MQRVCHIVVQDGLGSGVGANANWQINRKLELSIDSVVIQSKCHSLIIYVARSLHTFCVVTMHLVNRQLPFHVSMVSCVRQLDAIEISDQCNSAASIRHRTEINERIVWI